MHHADRTAPGPTGHAAPPRPACARSRLDWGNATGATGYLVHRRTSPGAYPAFPLTGTGTSNFSDSSLTGGTTYCYRVQALNQWAPGPDVAGALRGGPVAAPAREAVPAGHPGRRPLPRRARRGRVGRPLALQALAAGQPPRRVRVGLQGHASVLGRVTFTTRVAPPHASSWARSGSGPTAPARCDRGCGSRGATCASCALAGDSGCAPPSSWPGASRAGPSRSSRPAPNLGRCLRRTVP